jgi:HK97 family phage portal protein
MGIFSKLIKNKSQPDIVNIIDGFTNLFAHFGSDKLLSDVFLSAVQSNANHRSKLRLTHRLKGREQAQYKHILQLRPNPIMNATTFVESLSIDYDAYNNAFVFIDKNKFGDILGLWRINPSQIGICIDNSKNIFCRFTLQGNNYTVPYDNICHICKNVTKDEIFGDENKAINRMLDIINTNYQGIEAAVKTSGILRYWITIKDKVKDRDLRKKEKWFSENILNPLKTSGVKYGDIAEELKELTPANQKYGNFEEQQQYVKQVYNFLGTSEKIINGTNTDDEMIAFYERSVDTFALKLEQELTYKIFTAGELSHGNEIEAVPNRLAFMSMARRVEIANVVREQGWLTKGDLADLLFLPIKEEMRNELLPASQNFNENNGNNRLPVKQNSNLRFDPDQPRADDGTFGEGGGSNDSKDNNSKELHKKPKGAKLTKKEFAKFASAAMSDATSSQPKGFANDFDTVSGYYDKGDNVFEPTYTHKIKSKNKGSKSKWQKKKK